MIKKLLPIVLLLVGSGAGVGAGIFLRPDVSLAPAHDIAEDGEHDALDSQMKQAAPHGTDNPGPTMEYVKLTDQFVIPIVEAEKVVALVVMALSLEVPEGQKDEVFRREPKLRDSILQVLFDHANMGGFEGSFTDANTLALLRKALREVGQKVMGSDVVHDVLILEIARQDY